MMADRRRHRSAASWLWCLALLSLSSAGRAETPELPPDLSCLRRVSDGHWLGGGEVLEPGAVFAVDAAPGVQGCDTAVRLAPHHQ
jgi:hypothetical protein